MARSMSRRGRGTRAVHAGVTAWNARPPMIRTVSRCASARATRRSASANGSSSVRTASDVPVSTYGVAVLAGVPVVVVGFVTNWSVVAFVVGAFCVLLALIFASLTSVMPRSGGDYVFTSRIVPRIGPFLGWLESWMLAFASIALLQFETALTLRGVQMEGRIIGIGTGSDFFNGANKWFTDGDTGQVTGVPGMIAGLVVIAVVAFVVLQPTRIFHRIVTYLAVIGIPA